MITELNIRSTYFPEERLPLARWFRYVQGRDLDLTAINTKTFLGSCFVNMYNHNPESACREMLEAYNDNSEMVIGVIGIENLQKLLK